MAARKPRDLHNYTDKETAIKFLKFVTKDVESMSDDTLVKLKLTIWNWTPDTKSMSDEHLASCEETHGVMLPDKRVIPKERVRCSSEGSEGGPMPCAECPERPGAPVSCYPAGCVLLLVEPDTK